MVIDLLQVPTFNGGPRAGVSSQRSKERIIGVTGRALPWEEGSFSDTVSSQRSKENICEGNVVQNLSSSSIGGSRTRSASSTPSKNPSKETSKISFVTPSRPALQKARCFGDTPLPNPAVLAARRSLDINSDGSPKISLRAVGDLAEQVQSLKKEKFSLESQKMELETNFQQVQSQLDAVLLFQEVCSNEVIVVHPYRSVLFIATVLQDVSPEAESQQELRDERDKLKNRVGHLEAALSAALSERQRLMVGPSYLISSFYSLV
jgi:hypothetical protein